MPGTRPARKMLHMPASADLTRRVLVPLTGSPSLPAAAPRVRRYKLARMAVVNRVDPSVDRFAHLRRSYD